MQGSSVGPFTHELLVNLSQREIHADMEAVSIGACDRQRPSGDSKSFQLKINFKKFSKSK